MSCSPTTKRSADCRPTNIDYYLVLANWKLGIVLEKTYAAAVKAGKTDSPVAAAMGPMIPQLIATAADLTKEH